MLKGVYLGDNGYVLMIAGQEAGAIHMSENKVRVLIVDDHPHDSPLTNREKEILKYVADGMLNRDIATELVISEHTVKNHLKNL